MSPITISPNYRMPYDTDGAEMFFWSSQVPAIVNFTEEEKRGLNSENSTVVYSNNQPTGQSMVGFVFPELRTITHYFLSSSFIPTSIEYSTDTTYGIDGTWSNIDQTTFYTENGVSAKYRTAINAITMNSGNPITGIRFVGTASNINIKAVHLYGSKYSIAERIVFWHPTLDQQASPSYFDFGDIAKGTESIKQFRLKNITTNRTANNITVSLDATTSKTPALTDQVSISANGIDYLSGFVVNSLSSNSVSNIFYIKKKATAESYYGPYSLRIKTDPEYWTGG